MAIGNVRSTVDIAISGLRAQDMRMNTTASNIANINTAQTESGEAYRRKVATLSADPGGGVLIGPAAMDMTSALRRVYRPGPGADPDGYLEMPNVDLPVEMMEMMAASRAYQANAVTLKRYQDMVDVTLELLR